MKLLVVVASSLQDGHHLGIIVIVSLRCCCCRHPLVVNVVVGFWPSLSLCVAVVVVASSSQDGHRHKVVVVMALMSLSLCVAVVVVIPLLSTIVFVGLLDVGRHHCLFVLLLSSSRRRRKMVVVMALLSLSLCVVVVVVVPLFVNHCFCRIVGFWPSSSSLCVAVVAPLFLLLSVLGHHHCHSGLARFQLIFLYSYFAFYFMC